MILPIWAIPNQADSIESIAYSPCGMLLASLSKNSVSVWNISNGKETEIIQTHHGRAFNQRVSFSPDSTRVVTLAQDAFVLWDLKSKGELVRFQGSFPGNEFEAFTFSPNGNRVAIGVSSGESSGSIIVLETEYAKEILRLEVGTYHVNEVVFHPGGTQLASGHGDGTARIWDLKSRAVAGVNDYEFWRVCL